MQHQPQPAHADPSATPEASAAQLDRGGYRLLAEFRYLLRRFLEFSEIAARRAGLAPAQHQALLVIKGFSSDRGPTIGELAERLRIRHHSAVELVNRLVEAQLCVRAQDSDDHRRVLLGLTPNGERRLSALSAAHLAELRAMGPALRDILDRVDPPVNNRAAR